MVSAAVLTGALVVGDSVRHSLKMMVTARLGKAQLALDAHNRFFRADLANELAAELNTNVAPVLKLRGLIADSSGSKRANRIQVLGVDERFFTVGAGGNPFGDDWSEGIVLNEPLAAKLDVGVGDEVVLRIDRPGLMPRDVPLMPDSDLSIAFRLIIKAIARQAEFGRFSLQANQIAPLNVYVPMQWLQEKLDRSAQANMLLVASSANDSITVEKANVAIEKCWQLADASLELNELDGRDLLEIRSNRILIDESLSEAAINAADGAVGILTYFVNELRLGDRTTPYSMVTAMGRSADVNALVPMNMQDDEILINRWLADDLGAKVGDSIELTYYVLSPMRTLVEQKSSFEVRKVLPMDKPAVDPNLMPDFPGLVDSNNCRDWKPGIDIDLNKIHDEDEVYWDEYRGTPKAFVTLKAGQAVWANRYGNLTAVRYPRSTESEQVKAERLLSAVDPASVGLFFQSVRERGIKAGNEATDFGQLFLGLSMFLIAAALVLMGLLFVFGVENRSEQVGMLQAVGFSPKLIRRLFLLEGAGLAVVGAVAGAAVGLLYNKAMIYGLATVWQDAVSGSVIHFYAKPSTLFTGALVSVAISLIAIWFTLRKQTSRPARELLAGGVRWQFFAARPLAKGRIGLWVAIVATGGAAVLLVVMATGESGAMAWAFFAAGALLLIAGLGLSHALLKKIGGVWNKPMVSLAGLGLRNSTRRSGRSLAVIGLLACGVFLVIAVGANRHDPLTDAQSRDSGTGGFTLYGESAIGILHDLNSNTGRQALGLNDNGLEAVKIVQLRVNDGDDASCFNLNRAQRPRLLGVQPEQLRRRGAFGSIKTIQRVQKNAYAWWLLYAELGEDEDVVPAIADYATIVWALGKSIGDELEYSDEKGRRFRLRLVGMLKDSILQGSLLIAEDEFTNRFPSEDGYRMFLVDAPQDKAEVVAGKLSTQLRDFGLELTPATQRLAEFNAVENTYLSIFQLLGGLGLILGSVGLGLVVLRNVLDRRGELAMLRAVGFDKVALKRMVFSEHSVLCLCGLACGVIAALVAVGPVLGSPRTEVPYLSITLTIVAIGVSGLVWIWIATVFALSGKPLDALRNE
jgi:putative ABC transport system permease protein